MRVPLIAGNWKMNSNINEAVALVKEMQSALNRVNAVEKLVCPPFISIAAVKTVLKGSSIKVGAQNMYYEEKGAYTGEISPAMLVDLCDYVILGHSERRNYFNESNEVVNKKVLAALKVGLNPILCVGEKLEEREGGRTEEVVSTQLRASLANVNSPGELVIAYEPIWAIGTGRAATGVQANETISLIRRILVELFGRIIAGDTRILYGGSVIADNIAEFIRQPDIDGALVGGASLKADQFVSMVEQTAEIKK